MSRAIAAVAMVGASLLLLLSSLGLQGQDKPAPEKEPPSKVKKTLPTYWKQLNLSPTQKEKVHSLMNDYRTKIEALDTQLKKLKAEEAMELSKVLTADQRDQLRKIIESKVGGTGPAPDKKTDKTEPKKTEKE